MGSPPSTRHPFFLSTRFGRELFGLFVLCALGPIVALTLLSWSHVSDELREQSRVRLLQATHGGGMRIVDRLTRIAADLAVFDPERKLPDWVEGNLFGLAELQRDGTLRAIHGKVPQPPPLSDADRARLDAGAPLLREITGPGASTLVILQRGARGGWLIGELVPGAFELSVEMDLPIAAEYAVFTSRGAQLAGSRSDLPRFAPDALGERRLVSWSRDGAPYLLMGWTVFLRAAFDHPDIEVVVAEPEDLVLAPVAAFRIMLALVASAALTMVALLSAGLIRRRLRPLDQLRDGTRRVAAGDLTEPVRVASHDEIGELATSFNEMMSRLDSQFRSLDRLIEIDRAIFAAPHCDADVEDAFLAAFAELYPSAGVVLSIVGETEQVVHFLRRGAQQRQSARFPLDAEDRQWVAAQLEPVRLPIADVPELYKNALGVRTELLMFPLIAAGMVSGFAVAVDPEPIALLPERRLWAEQACSQLAAALHGARLRAENERLLDFDPSSGLPNRARFLREIEAVLAQTRASGAFCALTWIRLDGLERIRESTDIDTAQATFRRVADSLRSLSNALAGRLHFTELAAICVAPTPAAASDAARRAWAAVRDAAAREEGSHLLAIRAGVAVSPIDADHASDLLQRAETALRYAREQNEGALAFFSSELAGSVEARLLLERELPGAIRRGELRLYYQPIVDLGTRSLVGAEALVRWNHPERGLVMPSEFVPIAEETSLVAELGRWVIETACADLRRWQLAGLPAIQVKVNASARHLSEHDLLSDVRHALERSGISPACLAIELTETAVAGDDEEIRQSLYAVRTLGVGLTLDDFGTGYASLAYLRRFPFDSLKIDRSFVSGLPDEPDDRAIVDVILALAKALNLEVVAEGIEHESQLAHLRQCGCVFGQGYLFDRPLPADAFEKRLREWEP